MSSYTGLHVSRTVRCRNVQVKQQLALVHTLSRVATSLHFCVWLQIENRAVFIVSRPQHLLTNTQIGGFPLFACPGRPNAVRATADRPESPPARDPFARCERRPGPA